MRHLVLYSLLILSLIQTGLAQQGFTKKPTGKSVLIQQGPSKMWCPVCGMSLKGNYKTNHATILKDGSSRQYCSIRCLVVDHQHDADDLKKMLVLDVSSEKLIEAKRATYVIGSKAKGTMSKKSKYAFASLKGAEKFQQKFGGKIANFTEAFASAKQSLSSDIAMTDKKRQAKMYPMGKKIYTKKCKQIDPDTYSRINLIKADLKSKKLCGDLQEKQAQAVALYLWDVKRFEGTKADQKIQINKKDKCPVCGMFVYKYPKWAAQIVSIHNDHKHQFSFDGVKDMMKFYFDPEKWSQLEAINAKKIVVTDYYTQKAIDAKKAWYVSGSDQLGPMGNELIPFKTKHNAETFKSDHAGKSIIQFYQITPKMLKALDE